MERLLLDDSEEERELRARSRVGDFVFAAAAGCMLVVGMLMVGPSEPVFAPLALVLFLGALAVRYQTLADAPAVTVGAKMTEEQINTLRRLRTLVSALPQPILLLDSRDEVEMYNPAAERMFGAELLGRHVRTVIRVPIALEVLRMVAETGEPHEREFTTTESTPRTSLFYAAPLRGPGGTGPGGTIIMLRDRTEQKKLERMRTDFIANASHELRTPLTSMSGFIETLQGHARDDPRARDRFLEIMGQQTERMLRLVEDLIGLSAIELKEAKPPEDRIDLGGVAESVRDMMLPVVGREGGRLTFERPDTPLEMTADRHEVFRLIQNLCDNAVKYGTPEDGSGAEVHLSVGRGQAPTLEGATRSGETIEHLAVRAGIAKEELLWVRVADRGEGIDVNDLPRLTERFYRVNPQISREKGGTGLGLAIVKHIIQRHRGALQIETVAGEGAAFTCYFPPHISAIRQKKVAADRK